MPRPLSVSPMPEATRLNLLGRIDLRRDDDVEVRSVLAQPKRLALLAFLSMEGRSGAITRDRVIGVFWPDTTEERARSSLRTALYQLRQSLGSDVVRARRADLGINRARLECDAALLLDAAADGDRATVLKLYAGEFMEGFHLTDAADFDRWLEGRRAEIHRAGVAAATAEAALDPGSPQATRVLADLVERRPGEEEAVLRYLESVHRTRGAGAARAVHADWAKRYRERFEVLPDPAALELLDRLDGEAARGPPSEPQAAAPRPPGSVPEGSGRAEAPSEPSEPSEAPPDPSGPSTRPRGAPGLSATGPATPRRRAPTLLVGVLATAAVAAVWLASTTGPPSSSGIDATAGVAVTSFDVVAPAQEGHLGRLAGFLLGRELDESGSPPVWTAGVGSTPEGCEPSASAFGTRISGVVRVEGGRARIRACLIRDDRLEETWEVEGSPAGLHEAVASLARAIRADLDLSLPDEAAPPLTVAPGAHPAFVEGERHRTAGRFADAIAAYDRAVALDSTFAWAHYRRSTSAEWLGRTGEAKASADRATAHSSRLTARERTLLDAWRSYLWGDVEQARTAYVSLANARPTDADVLGRLGELRFHWGSRLGIPNDSADAAFRRVLELSPDHAPALLHRIRFAGRAAGLDELRELSARFSALAVPESELLEVASIVALRSGDESFLRERTVPWLLATDPLDESARLGGLLAATGAPAAVERLMELLPPADDETRAVARQLLRVYTAAMGGRMGLARERIAALGRSHPERAVELTAVLTLLPTAPDDGAAIRRALDAVRAVQPSPVPMGSRVKYASFPGIFPLRQIFLDAALSGRLAEPLDSAGYREQLEASSDLFKADYRRIVEGLEWRRFGEPERVLNAVREGWLPADRVLSDVLDYPTAVERWIRIDALIELGREDDALRWLRTFPDATGYDVAWLPAARVVEAEIMERRGLTAEAASGFRQALDTWSDADPEMEPWVTRAREGLERSGG